MRLTHLTLKNWRNFKQADFDLQDRLFIVGPNASGKSNLLDALRFLRRTNVRGAGWSYGPERAQGADAGKAGDSGAVGATRPPTSEWWARLATNPTSRSS